MSEIMITKKDGKETEHLLLDKTKDDCPICEKPLLNTMGTWNIFHGEVSAQCCGAPYQTKDYWVDPEKTDGYDEFFKKLNQHFYLFHIHGNNHAPRYVDFPDSLELTYVNKRVCDSIGVSQQRCPDLSVDEPNFDGRPDYVLDYWI